MFGNSFSNAPAKPGAVDDAAPQREARTIIGWLTYAAAAVTAGGTLVYFIASGIAHHFVYFIA